MDRNDSPGSLNEELHEESCGAEGSLGSWEDPCGDHQTGDERRQDNCSTSSNELAAITNDGTAYTCSCLHDDRSSRRLRVVHLLLGEHEGGVGVLPPMSDDCSKTNRKQVLPERCESSS